MAWTRSALNMAASGTLIARAGFAAHLNGLGIASALAMATMAYLTWRHGRKIYHQRGRAGAFPHHQPSLDAPEDRRRSPDILPLSTQST